MSTTAEFLASLRARDVRVWVEQDRLRCSAPAGELDEALKAALAARKDEIVAWLRAAEALRNEAPAIVPLKPDGRRPPLFGVPGHNGDVFCYRPLAGRLAAEQPLFGVQPPGLDGTEPPGSIEEFARYEVEQVLRCRPEGPYLLLGYCAGGIIAFEMARQLVERGHRVALLGMFGSFHPSVYRGLPRTQLRARLAAARYARHLRAFLASPLEGPAYLRAAAARRRAQREKEAAELRNPAFDARRRVERATLEAIGRYAPRPYGGRVDLFLPAPHWTRHAGRPLAWTRLGTSSQVHCGPADGTVDHMLQEPFVEGNALVLAALLDEIAREGGS